MKQIQNVIEIWITIQALAFIDWPERAWMVQKVHVLDHLLENWDVALLLLGKI